MKIMIVEDDFTSRLLLQEYLKDYGECHVASNGREAVEAMRAALDKNDSYKLICMDIMMPEMDGQEALRAIRKLEEDRGIFSSDGVRIIMTTAMKDVNNLIGAYKGLCDGYITKPVAKDELDDVLAGCGLVRC